MTLLLTRVASHTRWTPLIQRASMAPFIATLASTRCFSCCESQADKEKRTNDDPRINDFGRAIEDDFATIRQKYGMLLVTENERRVLTISLQTLLNILLY